MVEGQSMTTVADLVAQARDGRLEDFVGEAVVLVTRKLMQAAVSAEVGAGHGGRPARDPSLTLWLGRVALSAVADLGEHSGGAEP